MGSFRKNTAEEFLADSERRMSESEHQKALFEWAELMKYQYPELDMLFAVPNGGHRNKVVAAKLKAEGVRKGVSDLCLPIPRGGYGALFIEMKRKKGKLTKEQKHFIEKMNIYGNKAVVCFSATEAIEVIKKYLEVNHG